MNTYEDGAAIDVLEQVNALVSRSDMPDTVKGNGSDEPNGRDKDLKSILFNTEIFATTLRSRRARRKSAPPALRWQTRHKPVVEPEGHPVGAQADMKQLGLSVPRPIARKARIKNPEHAVQKSDGELLRSACLQAAQWEKGKRLMVALGDSSAPDAGFNERLAAILEDTGFDPACLDLVFSEDGLRRSDVETCFTLAALRDRGVGIYLSGFGSGVSSLTLLKDRALGGLLSGVQFDCSVLLNSGRLCRAQADDALLDPVKVAFYRAALSAVQALKLRIVACGVDTEELREFATAIGCHEMMGSVWAVAETLGRRVKMRGARVVSVI
ncbi:hypothetical protein AA106555_1226 [Neokomagataea thailandica NBRC 106555]|uniref:EAL domain-containing protein n=2 Tax=Neokomagataea TaxID=1223423 RepID=A0A4Y6V786_9PROT|nr:MULTISPECIES: EAL domain-containing protein [Neokomagataea]QDH24357.1 EAL domain-containing protein [Neokomagataea tanensis]GBR53254.1 hypothetical protein AA106555_1226 [Neokomagataea thailandica NBRC 106555]